MHPDRLQSASTSLRHDRSSGVRLGSQPPVSSHLDRFLRGKGDYTDDRQIEGCAWGVVLRSPHAHAYIKRINKSEALASSGVLEIYTGEDISPHVKPLSCLTPWTWSDGRPFIRVDRAVLAIDRVRHVGDSVAFVVAKTKAEAVDAAEKIEVDYEVLPPAIYPGSTCSPSIWDEAPDNVCFDWRYGDRNECNRLFALASSVTHLRLRVPRLVHLPIEPRAAIGSYNRSSDIFELIAPTQGAHLVRQVVAASFQLSEERFRVVTPDVGGGFGSKIFAYPEYVLVLLAAWRLGLPVRWTATRHESFVSDVQGRDHVTDAYLALNREGRFLAIRIDDIANLGAYQSQYTPFAQAGCGAPVQAGGYHFGAIDIRVKGVFTNTLPVDAMRGTGRPEATYVLERLIDQAAFELGSDPAELRARNLQPSTNKTVTLATGLVVDSGSFLANQTLCLERADRCGFDERRAKSEANGKLRGFGFANYLEANGSFGVAKLIEESKLPTESAAIRFNKQGKVVVWLGTQSCGQDHAGPVRRLVAATLQIEPSRISVLEGDTAELHQGGGTGGSKSTLTSIASVEQMLRELQTRAIALYAKSKEIDRDKVSFSGGRLHAEGKDQPISIMQLALAFPSQLDTSATATIKYGSFANGCHACEVEIDRETGEVRVVAYTAVDDFGTQISPEVVEAQVHGGVAMGLGEVLLECCVYDDNSGQILTGSLVDYAVPRAIDIPPIVCIDNGVACTTNAIGFKACGESGTTAAMPVVMNAIIHALRAFKGADRLQIPARACDIWAIMANPESQTPAST
jgi:aerobic carbon-monoxide dehydrogenase large subunit